MAGPALEQTLSDLRLLVRGARRRPARIGEAAPLLARLLAVVPHCRHRRPRAGGMAFRLRGTRLARRPLPVHLRAPRSRTIRASLPSEREVAERLCEGRTLAQIARLRGVTVNTVKSQVRQIFRKLDVDTRVALVRRLCP